MIHPYDQANPEHECDLAHLFCIANGLPEGSEIKSDANMDNLPMVNEDWLNIGF